MARPGGETELHKTLKREACRWLYRMGYRCIAAEVRVPPLGIVDAAGTGYFRPYHNYLAAGTPLYQTCFVECKAFRSDFLRDLSNDGQMTFALMERQGNARRKKRGRRTLRQRVGLGKFDACMAQPMANLHYLLAAPGVCKIEELPARWGLLVGSDEGIRVVRKAVWQEQARPEFVESSIARRLTCDIFGCDDRALESVNRELLTAQTQLADRIRALGPQLADQLAARYGVAPEKADVAPAFDARAAEAEAAGGLAEVPTPARVKRRR